MILMFNSKIDDNSSSETQNENADFQELFHKYFDTTNIIGTSLSKIDKLICDKLDDRQYFKIFKSLFSASFDESDLIAYLNYNSDKNYSGISTIKTNLLTKHTRDVKVGNSTFMKIEDSNVSYKVIYSEEFAKKHSNLLNKADIRELRVFIDSHDIVIIGKDYSEVIPGEFPFLVSDDKRNQIPMIDGSKICDELNETLKYGQKNKFLPFVISQIRSDDVKFQLCEIRNNLRTKLHNRLHDVSSLLTSPVDDKEEKVLKKTGD